MRPRVVILSGHSLFAEGVIMRLKQRWERVDLHVVDSLHPNVLEEIIEVQPAAVIIDAADLSVSKHAPLEKLLQVLPTIQIIHLDSQRLETQVIKGEQYLINEVHDLIDLIESPADAQPSGP